MPQVSIIVPVYKAENYIHRCINSILAQDYTDWELILVDDGSPDRCGEICDTYSTQDDRIKIIHKKNGGPASARNSGIRAATGIYALFVDADDWLSNNAVSILVATAKMGYDLVCSAYVDISEYGNVICDDFSSVNSNRTTLVNCTISGTGGVLWGKIFLLNIIRDNNIFLDEDVYMSEDMLFVLEYIQHCKKWGHTLEPIYFYNRMNENSQSTLIDASYIKSFEHFFDQLNIQLRSLNISESTISMYNEQRALGILYRVFSSNRHMKYSFATISNSEFFSHFLSTGAQKQIFFSLVVNKRWLILRTYNLVTHVWGKCKSFLRRRIMR